MLKDYAPMRTIAIWIVGLAAIMAGFEAAARLQRWQDAMLFVDCGGELCTFKGEVSRQFFTGDYEVDVPGSGVVVVKKDRWRGMSWVGGGGVHLPSVLAALAGLAIFGWMTLGDSWKQFRAIRDRQRSRG